MTPALVHGHGADSDTTRAVGEPDIAVDRNGNAYITGQTIVVEYSDLPMALPMETDPAGHLR